jgi:hypothetical protein
MQIREIVGVANRPDVNKYWVTLSCGHRILYDHSVDAIDEYGPGDELICSECHRELYGLNE